MSVRRTFQVSVPQQIFTFFSCKLKNIKLKFCMFCFHHKCHITFVCHQFTLLCLGICLFYFKYCKYSVLQTFSQNVLTYFIVRFTICIFMPPLKKEGHIALHMSVGMSVCRSVGMSVGMSVALNLVQLITQERFAPEPSNLVRR